MLQSWSYLQGGTNVSRAAGYPSTHQSPSTHLEKLESRTRLQWKTIDGHLLIREGSHVPNVEAFNYALHQGSSCLVGFRFHFSYNFEAAPWPFGEPVRLCKGLKYALPASMGSFNYFRFGQAQLWLFWCRRSTVPAGIGVETWWLMFPWLLLRELVHLDRRLIDTMWMNHWWAYLLYGE